MYGQSKAPGEWRTTLVQASYAEFTSENAGIELVRHIAGATSPSDHYQGVTMKRSTMSALAGCALAASLLGYGYRTTSAAEAEYNSAVESCEREMKAAYDATWLGKIACSPYEITKTGALTESQKRILAANSLDRNMGGFSMAAFFIALVMSIPAIWYFLLARLREVAAAIRG